MTMGIDPMDLAEDDLFRELRHLHATRTETLLHGSADALANHTTRTEELEGEYLRRHPERDVDPERLRDGARRRQGAAS
ncbi:DUF6158 family protein [Streptosporangium roseum]|uniref:Uncharacterized protein n=1 Tax=Streptosporangium roseum (strain ATCC 12428 / DSM 43021 / JCM 3005 / KCTC 9067 / NCIMB 10171 / NRRL 2505 / NI 9100) TaxID=479432 RepID=D2B2X7_STRRD|nr:DUF6158 family protein [Streptosporangium roseum]ACZ85457.1 hypothetical protein Sros_2481 [Streptosporangium roseum DSM 43021]